MGKIYVLTVGHYSDYHIITATTSLEKAKKIAKKYYEVNSYEKTCHKLGSNYDDVNIEMFEDGFEIDLPAWEVNFKSDGVIKISKLDDDDVKSYFCTGVELFPATAAMQDDGYLVGVFAKDEEHAKKIACDMVAEYKAMKEGI